MSEPGAPAPTPTGRPPRSPRPAYVPPGESEGSKKLRKRLILWMLITCVALLGTLGVRLYQKLNKGERSVVNVKEEADSAWDKARDAGRDFLVMERKAAEAKDPLPAGDFEPLKERMVVLQQSHDKLKELLDMLHERGLAGAGTHGDVVKQWLQVKFWILDADDFLTSQKAAPAYGGYNVAMRRLSIRVQTVHDELKKLETTKADVQGSTDGAVRGNAISTLKRIEADFAAFAEECLKLEDYVKKGLAQDEISSTQIPELEPLREESTRAMMGRQQARALRSTIAPP